MKSNLKNFLIPVLGLFLAVSVVAIYVVDQKDENIRAEAIPMVEQAPSDIVTSTIDTAEWNREVNPFEASFAEVLASGNDYGCHYTSPSEEGNLTGTIFVSAGNARGTIIGDIFNAPGSLVSFLLTKEHTYLWYASDAFDEQMKGKALLLEATTTKGKMEIERDIARNLTNLYGCVPWEFESGFFTLPKDIQFIDHTSKLVTI